MQNFKLYFEEKLFNFSFKNIILFGFIWLMVGFSTGTAILLGPVRWITTFFRDKGFSQSTEDLSVKIIIIAFILISALISLWLTKYISKTDKIYIKVGILLIVVTTTVTTLLLWLNPQVMTNSTDITTSSQSSSLNLPNIQFIFGQYPLEPQFVQLKNEGYTAIISLLHPAVVPFEPKLLADEKQLSVKIGLEVIHLPMLPWVSGNEKSLAKIKELTTTGKGKYYVHCYLGKDRINVVKRIIEQYNISIQSIDVESVRFLDEIEKFERGKIIKLASGIYFTPYPTDEEFFAFILSGNFKKVISILDSTNSKNKDWITKEKNIMKLYQMPFEVLSIDMKRYNSQEVLEIVNKIKNSPKPVVVHGFRTDSQESKAFIQTFNRK
jgi:hypothetical protein